MLVVASSHSWLAQIIELKCLIHCLNTFHSWFLDCSTEASTIDSLCYRKSLELDKFKTIKLSSSSSSYVPNNAVMKKVENIAL